jgi:hypothetical protein
MDGTARIDSTTPNDARVWDTWLGGKDNYAVDREAAAALAQACPGIREAARDSRAFIIKAVGDLAGRRGIGQYIDLGCGFPATPTILEAIREHVALARIVFADNDPVVLAHRHALSAGEGIGVLDADLRDPENVLRQVSAVIDFARPAAVILGAVLGTVPADEAREVVTRYATALAPKSAVVLSLVKAPGPHAAERLDDVFPGWQDHGEDDVASWFTAAGLQIAQAAVGDVKWWPMLKPATVTRAAAIGAVGFKTGLLPRRTRRVR